MQLNLVGQNIWTFDGIKVKFYGFPFPTRMTIIRLKNNALWIHSPEKLNSELEQELSELGEVKYLISPNKLHHLFLPEWIERYPNALNYSAPGLAEKRKDIQFNATLSDKAENTWVNDIAQVVVRGSPVMEEVVFFHKPSSTLIVTDLIENFDPATLSGWQRAIGRMAGIVHPNGKTPIDWRVTFRFGSREKAREALNTMLSWNPTNIIVSHGICVFGNGAEFLNKSFKWLNKG